MDPFEHTAIVAHFLAGNRVELTAVDGALPLDPENGDAEYCGLRAIMAVTRQLKCADPSISVYVRHCGPRRHRKPWFRL